VEWDEAVTVSRHAAETARYRMGLRKGETAPLGHAASRASGIASANDAAAAVAEHLWAGPRKPSSRA
jgi:D-alanyl-D-alanine carboxypeptidase